MKKTLAAVAVLGAFAASASADVTVYGRVDMGVNYNTDTENFQVKSGQSSGNRWGLMGAEKISEDLTVGFQLEAGFDADTGADKGGFNRESRLFVKTGYGTFHFGRMGTLSSGAGTVSIADNLTVMGTGYGAFAGNMNFIINGDTRRDNVITYQSPVIGGATFYVQAASDEADGGYEHHSTNYYAAAVEYKAGAFSAGLVASLTDGACTDATEKQWAKLPTLDLKVESPFVNVEGKLNLGEHFGVQGADVYYSTADAVAAKEGEEKTQVIAGVGYDFGVAKVKLTAAYTDYDVAGEDSYGVLLGVAAPVAGGELQAQVGYADGYDGETADVERQSVAAMYTYALSKRTSLYVGAGWQQEETKAAKEDATEFFAGMLHKF